jgi:hypothetical protein
MHAFLRELRIQRWDDHRFYHHSRINQSLHFISALSFLIAYGVAFFDPPKAALIAWLVAMVTRQSGHFFFEPRGYDQVNQVTHEHKEEIKVGYNLRRKVVLHAVWAGVPVLLWLQPDLFGLIEPAQGFAGWLRQLGWAWFGVGVGALVLRTAHLCVIRSPLTGFAWFAKILTDPFNDALLYRGAPAALLRGELIDPLHARHLR